MTEKPWLQSYPEGVPEYADIDAYNSVVELFDESVEQFRDNTAFISMGKSITFGELDEYSRAFAAWIQASGKFKKGDRIALMMPNTLQYPIAVFGLLRAGMTAVNTNPLYTRRELQHQLEDSDAKGIVIVENFANTLERALKHVSPEVIITTRVGDMLGFPKSLIVNSVVKYVKKMVPAFNLPGSISFTQVLKEGADLPFEKPSLGHDDLPFCNTPVAPPESPRVRC